MDKSKSKLRDLGNLSFTKSSKYGGHERCRDITSCSVRERGVVRAWVWAAIGLVISGTLPEAVRQHNLYTTTTTACQFRINGKNSYASYNSAYQHNVFT